MNGQVSWYTPLILGQGQIFVNSGTSWSHCHFQASQGYKVRITKINKQIDSNNTEENQLLRLHL